MAESSVLSAQVFQSEIVVAPLQFPQNISAIDTFLGILKTSIGPNGKLKMIQNFPGSHVTVTSSSSRLFHIVPVKNLIVKFIIAATNTHLRHFGDGGLYCALLTMHLLKNAEKAGMNTVVISELYKEYGKIYYDILNSSHKLFSGKVELSNMNNLCCIVRSIISSKPGCTIKECEKEPLTLLLIKAFVNSIPEFSKVHPVVMRHSVVFNPNCGHSPNDSKLFNGLLLKTGEASQKLISKLDKISKSSNKPFKLAVFSVDLSDDSSSVPGNLKEDSVVSIKNEIVLHLKKIAVKLICDGAEIVLCQKGMELDIRRQLEDNELLVIERLGAELTTYLQHMTGSVPVSSLSDATNITYGFATSFESMNIGNKSYVLIQDDDRPFQTILLCHSDEEALDEMQVVCKQAMDTLYRLIKDPRICCGGGCTDICISQMMRKEVLDRAADLACVASCTHSDVLSVLGIFTETLTDVALSLYNKSRFTFITDKKYGHLWEVNEGEAPSKDTTCKCGRYIASSIDPSEWIFFTRNEPVPTPPSFSEEVLNYFQEFPSIPDELAVKINSSICAFETSSSLLQIGLCIVSDS